jgi:hypothetical protein
VDAAHYVDPIGNRVLGFDHIKQVRGILSAEREREREGREANTECGERSK